MGRSLRRDLDQWWPTPLADAHPDEVASGVEVLETLERTAQAARHDGSHERLRLLWSTIEIQRSDERLQRVGQDRRLGSTPGVVLTRTQQQLRTEVDLTGDLGQHFRVDQTLADVGEGALVAIGELGVDHVGHDPLKDRVTEEFEPLVRGTTAVLTAPRTVAHGLPTQLPIREPVGRHLHRPLVESESGTMATAPTTARGETRTVLDP